MPPRSRSRVLTHQRFARTSPPDPAQRELTAIREIVHALLNADRPEEVFQFALDRLCPIIGASFASVYLVEGVSELMRLAAAWNWPARYRPWLGDMRVRLGFGPSGEAAAERRIIEVPDVRVDKGLEDWAEVARELGFLSLVALPLQHARGALGAVTFYFAEEGVPSQERRNLMRLVAEQMAATAEKMRMTDELRRANAALSQANADLDAQFARGSGSIRERDELLIAVSSRLHGPIGDVAATLAAIPVGGVHESARQTVAESVRALENVSAQVAELLELASLRAGEVSVAAETFTLDELLEAARSLAGEWGSTVHLPRPGDEEGTMELRSDRRKAARAIAGALDLMTALAVSGSADADLVVEGQQLTLRFTAPGVDTSRILVASLFDWVPAEGSFSSRGGAHPGVSRALARLLGGDLEVTSTAGEGTTVTVRLPLVYLPEPPVSHPQTHPRHV